jgi:hypothetical protein
MQVFNLWAGGYFGNTPQKGEKNDVFGSFNKEYMT